ncbi:MAG: hypothetical protein A2992_02815 [Elusimicrobia bacterium RIFCSPLOWO2_01_FULL_59_12]|nr:MAG: hypothetical protein A2992_02815 [Elusimicrobia bacterium RIFCSPLOWO2_01_FULL_59_12]
MERLESRIERFLRTGSGDFEDLALELFAHQFEKSPPYQAYCKAQNRTPGYVRMWEEIPAVPIAAFKSADLATFPVGRAAAVFHSSGTTQKTPSRHFLKTLTFYEASLEAGFSKNVLFQTDPAPFLILAPSPSEAPHSSLSWMLDVVNRRWGLPAGRQGMPGGGFYIQRGLVEDGRLFRALEETQAAGSPIALLGTTLAFLAFFDQCAKQNKSFLCPTGSRLMDTGGMKTQAREVTRGEFLRRVWSTLGIPEAGCINEYGMCELSSQFYARGASPVFKGPPWVRTLVVNPNTGAPLPEGETGWLTHFDLANVDSALAVQTEDEGIAHPEGFVLLGRARSAGLKGCSVDMEAYLKRQ